MPALFFFSSKILYEVKSNAVASEAAAKICLACIIYPDFHLPYHTVNKTLLLYHYQQITE